MIRTFLSALLGLDTLRHRVDSLELRLAALTERVDLQTRLNQALIKRVETTERDVEDIDRCIQALEGGEVVYVAPGGKVEA